MATYDNTGQTVLGVAVALQLIGDGNEDTGGQSHVEDAVLLLLALFDLVEMLVEVDERIILVVLTGDVGAHLAEVLEELLDFFCGHLDVRLDTLKVFFVVHLCPGISDNLDILGEELVAVLKKICRLKQGAGIHGIEATYETKESRELIH